MECIYFTDFNEETKHILIQNEEIRHLRSLRIGKGDKILVSNGKGICAISVLINNIKGKYHFQVEEILKNYGELPYRLGLGVGILNDGKRFEFALEKAVELGITDFYPIISEYSEKKNLRLERLEKKVISALKQSKRSVLTNLHKPININDIHTISNEYDSVILADTEGINTNRKILLKSTLCLVGPEGGFSDEEIYNLRNLSNLTIWNLGKTRLRTETASTAILSIVVSKIK
jgi:16S rRNA (uracil1498-N3)-methyltransferase